MAKDELEITLFGEPYKANRNNTVLFTFFGQLAMYDHVFLITESINNGEKYDGAYIFKQFSLDGGYKALYKLVKAHQFTQHVNMQEIGQGDMDAYEQTLVRHTEDLGDYPDWLPPIG